MALLEFRDYGGPEYARAVVANTRRFGRLLADRGLTLAGADRGFSGGHQLWLDTEADGVAPKVAADRLADAGLKVNFMAGLPGFAGQGVRIGLNEATYRGLFGTDFIELADVFAAAVRDERPSSELADRVARLRRRTPFGAPVEEYSPLLREALSLCAGALQTTPVAAEFDYADTARGAVG
jgi:glycine/serine hydroxymethyltransferase